MNKQVKLSDLKNPRRVVGAIGSEGSSIYKSNKDLMDKKCSILNNNCIEYAYIYDGLHFEIYVSEENYNFAHKALENEVNF